MEALHQELEARIASLSDSVSTPVKSAWHCARSRNSCSLALEFDAACAGLAGSAKQSQPVGEQCGEEFTSSQDVTEYLQQCWSVSERRLLNAMKWARAKTRR